MNSIEIPRIRNTTCLMDANGGVLIDSGGVANVRVAITFAVAVGLIIPAVMFTLVGVILQEVTVGVSPVQVKFTVPVKPCVPATVTGMEPATPLVRLNVAGAVTVKDPVAEPVPLSPTLSALRPVPICSVAVSAAATDGVKITPIVQEAAAANDAPHGVAPLAVAPKSPRFAPTTVKGIAIDADELFVSVTNCAAVGVPSNCDPKLKLVGDTPRAPTNGKSATKAFRPAALFVAVWYAPCVVNMPVVA